MNHEEFNRWAKDFGAAFPQTREWMRGLPDPQATLKVWRSVLADVTSDEAALVTMKLAAGDLPAIKAFDREQTAATIRRHILDLRHKHERRNDGLSEAELYTPVKGPSFACGAALQGLLADMAKGTPKAEALAKWLPESKPEDCPRYRCLDCKDSGLRKVWAIKSMTAAKEGRLTRRNSYEAVTRCQCSKGGEARFERLAEFNVLKWCEYGNGDWETEAENLREFMADYASNAAERMSNFEPSFANY